MKAKLIKTIDGYELFTQGFLKSSTNHGLIESLNIEEGPIRYKLSLRNCQAIERGYDLDELISESNTSHLALFTSDSHELMYDEGYKAGFQKALELISDKKFSEADVINIAEYVRVASQSSPSVRTKYLLAEYQSQQQDEWDVEVVMVPAMSNNGNVYYGDIPKLDSGGCLTLKRI